MSNVCNFLMNEGLEKGKKKTTEQKNLRYKEGWNQSYYIQHMNMHMNK